VTFSATGTGTVEKEDYQCLRLQVRRLWTGREIRMRLGGPEDLTNFFPEKPTGSGQLTENSRSDWDIKRGNITGMQR
jgi:hypothetical protein